MMERNKSGNQAEGFNSRENVLKRFYIDMRQALDKFGPKEILDLLPVNSRRDAVAEQLLLRFPAVVATGEFLNTLPTCKVDKRTFKRLEKRGYLI
jgi:hypothetical protein